jgi:carbonic anhydrase/acetyltransferase-like protein (isoleucine patch superfamily)
MKIKQYLVRLYYITVSIKKRICFCCSNRSVHLGKDVQIIGVNNLQIGQNVTLSDRTWININKRKGIELTIGNNSFIGRNNFFTTGKEIILGDYFFSSIDCSFIGSSHLKNVFFPYILNETEEKNSIKIGTNVFFGAHSKVIGNVTIGCGTIIGASAVVTSDIPQFSIAVGNPAKVIKYYDFDTHEWQKGQRKDNAQCITESEYKKMLEKKCAEIPRFEFAKSVNAGWL